MTAMPPPAWTPDPRPPSWSAGRIVALVLGVVLACLSSALLLGGTALLAADVTERSGDGYLVSPQDRLTGPGYALVSERIDLSTGADWLPISAALGSARIEVTGTGAGSETFIGIAPVADVTAYLDGVQRTVIDDLGLGSAAASARTLSGGEPAGPPGEQDFWTEQASGPGTQRLTWVPAEGDWMLVVMNADGSAGISVDARIGATVPALDGIAWGLIVSGLVFLVVGVLLLVLALRRPADRRGPARPVAWPQPAGPQPAGPPAPGAQASGPPASGPPARGQVPPWTPPVQPDRTTAPEAQPPAENRPPQS